MAQSTSTSPVNITLSSIDVYILLIVFGILAAALGFVTHTFAAWIGYAGVATVVVSIFQLLADEFFPQTWVEYLVVTVIAAIVGVFGYLTGVANIDLVTLLTWGLGIASAVYKAVSDSGGQFLSTQQETVALGITGAAVSFLSWWAGSPTATTAAVITTLIATVAQFVRVSVQAGPSTPSVTTAAKPT
jgi:hypothetical protein